MKERGPGGFQSRMIAILKAMNSVVCNVEGLPQAGWPDLLVYGPKWSGHLELKVHGKRVDPAQRMVMMRIDPYVKVYVLRYKTANVHVETWSGRLVGKIPWNNPTSLEERQEFGSELFKMMVN